MLEIILGVISAIVCIICGYYVGVIAGKKETCDIVKENNKEVLIAREHIEYQIQNEKAHLKSLQDNVEQQKKSFEDFEKLEKENIMKNLRDFQIQPGRRGVGKGVSRDFQGVRSVRIVPLPNRVTRPRRASVSGV